MAIIYSYPTVVPKVVDKLIITQTYDSNDEAPVEGNPTRSAAISDILALVGQAGTANTLSMFSGAGLADSLVSQDSGIVFIGTQASGTRFTNTSVNTPVLGGTDLYITNIIGSNGGLLNIQGNAIIGNEATDTLTVNSVSTFNADVTALGNATFGDDDSASVTMEATLNLQGPVKDSTGTLGGNQQVLVSNASGGVSWGAYTTGTVKGTGAVNFLPKWSATDTLQDSIIFDNGTNVGIGTSGTNPADKLHVQGTVRAVIDTGSGFGFLTNRGTENSASGIRWDNNNSSLTLKDSTNVITTHIRSSGFSYLNGGKVGIGTTTPLAALDVKETTSDVPGQIIVGGLIAADDKPFGKLSFANTAAANSQPNKILASIEGRKNGSSNRGILTFDVSDGSGALKEQMRIDSYGFIGIGTVNPQRELDVAGDVRITGTLDLFQGNNNSFAGTNAGNLSNITAGTNTGFGKNSQLVNISGGANTSMGAGSLGALVTGNENTAIGINSMLLLNGGNRNVAVGADSLSAATTGNGNTAIGHNSLGSTTTTFFNTAVGEESLGNITTGTTNTGIGNKAGKFTSDGTTANATGNYSVFIGDSAKAQANAQNNQIVIGYNTIGNGTHTATIGNSTTTALHVGGNNAGIVLKSPDGTAYKIKVTNAGALTVTAL